MASPNDPTQVPTFRWDPVLAYAKADVGGRPYAFDGSAAPVSDTVITDLVLDTVVAVIEKGIEGAEGTRIGMFRGQRMTLTVLDVDFQAIVAHGKGRFADAVMAGGTEYRVQEIPRPDALFDVDVWTIHAFAQGVDEYAAAKGAKWEGEADRTWAGESRRTWGNP